MSSYNEDMAEFDAETTKMIRLSSKYTKEGWVTIGVIGHTESGKTTLIDAIDKCLEARKKTIKPEPIKSIKLVEINESKQFKNFFDPSDKWPETIKLLEESIEVMNIHPDQERLTYPYTKEKFKHEIKKITSNYEHNNELIFKLKPYRQNRKKGK